MAAITSAVVIAAGSAYAANRQGAAAKKAAGAQESAANAANAESRYQFDTSRQDNMPWLNAGSDALTKQQAFLNGDTSGFENSNDYKFALDQGFQGLNRGAAANGSFGSGGADADRIALGQGLATQYAGNYYNKLAGLSGTGQQSAQYLGGLGSNFANQFGRNTMNAGNARASSYLAQGETQAGYGNALAAGLGAYAGGGGGFGMSGSQPTGWGAFTPNQSSGSGGWDGSNAFGQWGQGWGG